MFIYEKELFWHAAACTWISSFLASSYQILFCHNGYRLYDLIAFGCKDATDQLWFYYAGINHFHQTPNREWFETDAVLRVSLGNFLFFTILSVLMVGVKSQKDPRDGLHHGGWMMKIICWCLLVIFMFFLPNEIISFYGKHKKFFWGLWIDNLSVCNFSWVRPCQ